MAKNRSFCMTSTVFLQDLANYFGSRKWHRFLRGPKTHPKSRNTKRNAAFTRTFSKGSRELCLLPCDLSQEPSGKRSEELVQMNFLFWVDFSVGVSSCEIWTMVCAQCCKSTRGWSGLELVGHFLRRPGTKSDNWTQG